MDYESGQCEAIACNIARRMHRAYLGGALFTLDDAYQVARIAAWRAAESYDPSRGSFESWVTFKVKSALNESFRSGCYGASHTRAGKARLRTVSYDALTYVGEDGFEADTFGYSRDFAAEAHQAELAERWLSLIRCLPARERLVVVWRYYDELTFSAIARRLRISDARALQLHGQGLRRLRDYAARESIDD